MRYRLLANSYHGDGPNGPITALSFQPVPAEGQTLVDVQGTSCTIATADAELVASLVTGRIYEITIAPTT